MKMLLVVCLLAFAPMALSQSLITDTYITEIEQNIKLLESMQSEGVATDRDKFMLKYYKERLQEAKATETGGGNRVAFTTAVVNKEPSNNLNEVNRAQRQVTFFSELKNLTGKAITHRWVYNGQVVYSKTFNVGAASWRVWTQKTITPYQGVVTVQIVDPAGTVLQTASITVR